MASLEICLHFFKCILARSADGADPIFGDFFPRGAGGNAVIRIADYGIIFVAAEADVFCNIHLIVSDAVD